MKRLSLVACILLLAISSDGTKLRAFRGLRVGASSGGNVPASGTAFISSTTSGFGDDNSTGLIGFQFAVGASGITVTHLGMKARADDSDNTKTVAIYNAGCTLVVSASVDISPHDGTDKFTAITPTALLAEGTYHCVFSNPNGRPFAYGSVPTHTGVASIPQDVWAGTVGNCYLESLLAEPEMICAGPNFRYQ